MLCTLCVCATVCVCVCVCVCLCLCRTWTYLEEQLPKVPYHIPVIVLVSGGEGRGGKGEGVIAWNRENG